MTPAQDAQGRYIPPEEAITGGTLASAARTTTDDDLTVVKASDVYTVTFGGSLAETNVAQMTSSAASLSATDLTPEVKVFGPIGSKSRWAWTIGGTGTPTFTFAVSPVTANRDN